MNKFLSEILEQPQALKKTLTYYLSEEGKLKLKKVKDAINEKQFEQIVFTGMGSSYFTSIAASTLFNELEMHSFSINASELLHYNSSILNKKTLLICFSQSGESFEIIELLKKLPISVFCVGISNEENSTLAKSANIVLLSKAGKEEMTSTKTYVSTTLVSFILAWSLAGKWNNKKVDSIKDLINNFKLNLKAYHSRANEAISFIGNMPALSIIARGPSISTAYQSGLMFKETTKIPAFGVLGGEFRHGPMEMVQEGFKSVLFASKGKTLFQSIKMAEDIAHLGGKVILITNAQLNIYNNNILILPIEAQDDFMFTIQSIIPIQLFIDSYTKDNGYEAGNFVVGAKVTMVE